MLTLERQRAKITNLNVRKEAAGDDDGAVVAIDVKMTLTECPAGVLAALAPVDPGDLSIMEVLWKDNGAPRFNCLSAIEFDTVFEKHAVTISGLVFSDGRLKGFRLLKLYDGNKADIEFTAQVHPGESQIGAVAEKIKDEVVVSTVGIQGELGV